MSVVAVEYLKERKKGHKGLINTIQGKRTVALTQGRRNREVTYSFVKGDGIIEKVVHIIYVTLKEVQSIASEEARKTFVEQHPCNIEVK